MNLDHATLRKFINLAQKKLTGRWVLLGGTLLPFLEIHHRVTVDIDFVGLSEKEQSQSLVLMEIAEELKLPIETINQAAAFYLKKISGFESDLEPIFESKNLSIFRPNLKLYLKLKLPRLTESDYTDCLELIRLEKKKFKKAELEKVVQKFLKNEISTEKKLRMENLLSALK